MMKLTATKFHGLTVAFRNERGTYRFPELGGWGVTNEAGQWLTFDGVTPYVPCGGRRAAAEVADTIIQDAIQFLTPVS